MVEKLVCPVAVGVVVLLILLPVPVVDVDEVVSPVTVCSVTALVWKEIDCAVTVDVVVLLTLPVPVVSVDEEV